MTGITYENSTHKITALGPATATKRKHILTKAYDSAKGSVTMLYLWRNII
jgi:hypothetical protein